MDKGAGGLFESKCPVLTSIGDRWPGWRITDDRERAIMCVATEKTLVEGERWWLTGSLGGLAGTQDVRVGDVLHVRTEVVREAVLHESNTALCALLDS